MKKRLFFIGIISFALCLLFSCGGKNKPQEDDPSGINPPVTEHTHSWGSWIEQKKANCTEPGEKMRKCNSCDEKETEQIPALNHNFKDGYCTRCKEIDPANTEIVDGKEFVSITISNSGLLSFSRLKCASKYVLNLSNALYENKTIELDKTQGSYSLESIPVGKTMVTLTAYEKVEIKVGNETQYQDVPISSATDEFRITKINNTYSLERLKYMDDYITLKGFYSEPRIDSQTKEKYYLYECVLKDNKPMTFKIKNYLTLSSGYTAVFYKSAEGRQNADSKDIWDSTNLLMGYPQINHGDNMYYVRILDSNGNFFDYNLNVYGLYTVELERYAVELNMDMNGYRTYEKEKLGNALTFVENDIIPLDILYENVETGKLGRDDSYNIWEREDHTLTLWNSFTPDHNNKIKVSIYFYDENDVHQDSLEYKECGKTFNIIESEYGITLSTSGNQITDEVTIPSVLVGKKVLAANFFSSEATTIYIAEGATEFVAKFNYCYKIKDIWLPSTITSMNEFAFGGNPLDVLPSDLTIHCAFDKSVTSAFPYKWNSIAGTTKAFHTVYGVAAPIVIDGVTYKISNNELVVTGTTNEFTGIIPDSIKLYGKMYLVTTIEHLDLIKTLKIGKNIATIKNNAFTESLEELEIDTENQYFIIQDQILYTKEKDRIIVVTKTITDVFLSSNVLRIDGNAFTNCKNIIIYTELLQMPSSWNDCDFANVTFVYNYKETIKNGDYQYLLTNANTACLLAYTGVEREVIIEDYIEGAMVTEIAPGAFKNCIHLESIILPNTIKTLGDNIFDNCKNLKYIQLPFIGTNQETPTMFSMIVGENVSETIERITITNATTLADQTFKGCTHLVEINLPDCLQSIGEHVFDDCQYLNYYTYNGVKYLGNAQNQYLLLAALENNNLTELEVRQECKAIDQNAFHACNSLEKVQISLYLLDQLPVKNIKNLIITSGMKIDANTFDSFENLESLSLPEDIIEIDMHAFNWCPKLNEIIISDYNQKYSVYKGVIYNKTKTEFIYALSTLKIIEIPSSVEILNKGALSNVRNIEELSLPFAFGGESNPSSDSKYLGFLFSTKTSEEGPYYINKNVPLTLRKVVITGGTEVYCWAFDTCDYIQEIILPDTITSIGQRALYCKGLTNLTIPFIKVDMFDGSISEYFRDYFGSTTINGVTTYHIPSSLSTITITGKTIPSRAFQDCTNIKHIYISNEIESIPYLAFNDCSNLEYNLYDNGCYLGNEDNPYIALIKAKDRKATEMIIHESTKIISNATANFSNIIIPSTVRTLGASAFAGSALKEIEIPATVKEIGEGAFSSCLSLTQVYINEGVEVIGDRAFRDCYNLKNINLPNSLKSVGEKIFILDNYNSIALEYNLYDNGLYLGNEENPYLYFVGVENYSITSIEIQTNTRYINEYAFSRCSSLSTIIMHHSVESIGEGAFHKNLKKVFYTGTSNQWENIRIGFDSNVSSITYYYSETSPTSSGNYWHYVENQPVIW
ncbi:MAG: leucine-rich repeat domain-containing protein [Anaeroplasmataceae bacterium]|nr:leucine-rich repeat domain-containing protein [Anaeroplasmataceae bacterium]